MNDSLEDTLTQLIQASGQGETEALRYQVASLLAGFPDSLVLAEGLDTFFKAQTSVEPPQKALIWGLCGRALSAQKRFDEALGFFKAALQITPDAPVLLNGLGFAQYYMQQWAAAENTFTDLLARNPEMFGAWMGLGMTRRKQDKQFEALECYEAALKIRPESHEAWFNRGNVLFQLNRLPEAYYSYEKSGQLCPGYLPALKGQITVLRDTNQPEPAGILLTQALKLAPDDRELLLDWGRVCQMLRRLDDARQTFQGLLEDSPDWVEPMEGLGNVAFLSGDTATAITLYQKVLAKAPDGQMYHNLGVALTREKKYAEAITAHASALKLNPEYRSAHINHALLHLLQGDFSTGLPEYEWRLKAPPFANRQIPYPLWQGEPLAGKTLFILTEQGFGDTFMYLRFLPALKAQGATIVFECRPELWSLLAACPDIDVLVETGSWQHAGMPYDYYCYLISVPNVLKTTLETIPPNQPGQFVISDALQAQWRVRLAGESGFKIGITWASKADHPNAGIRSCGFPEFLTLTDLPGSCFYSFQKGSEDVLIVPEGIQLEDLGPELRDFADTVAAVSCMDLVITVDTALAHVAGSLNIPVWVVLPDECDWRWFVDREDSPWYPSMRLFRQARFGDWPSAFQKVYEALEQKITASAVS